MNTTNSETHPVSKETVMVKEDNTYTFDPVLNMVAAGNRIFFLTNRGNFWRSDGTTAGTVFLKNIQIEHLVAFGNNAYAIVRSSTGGQELWKSDGTSAGTVRVKTIRAGMGPTSYNALATAIIGNIFYFIGHDGIHGYELWRSDGTATGTYMVKDLRPDDNNVSCCPDILHITAFNNSLFINAEDSNGQLSLFKSDGTNEGTQKIHDAARIFAFIPYDDQLLFLSEEVSGFNLRSTDGTAAGTTHIRELPAPNDFSMWVVEVNNAIYLAYPNSMLIWRTDGTACGTFGIDVRLPDVSNLAPLGSNLLFSAKHPYYGNELFAFNTRNVVAPACPEVAAAGHETSGARDNVEAERVVYTPNPFDRDLTVVINSDRQSSAEVVVHDMAGQPVTSQVLQTNTTYHFGSNWREGIYIMRIYVDGKVTHQRVVKGRQ